MEYDFPLCSSANYDGLGAGTGTGTTVAAANANAKNTYVTIGTSTFSYDGFYAFLCGGATAGRKRWDIAANLGGSDQIIAADLFSDQAANSDGTSILWAPVRVPSGAILKARIQPHTANAGGIITLAGYRGDAKRARGFSRIISCTDWTNSDPTNSVTLNGTTQTGWTQICASTPNRLAGLYATFTNLGNAVTGVRILVDIGFGGAGSEKVLLTFLRHNVLANGPIYGPFPCDIPAGTRLSVRMQASGADTQVVSVVLNGIVP